MSGKASKLHRIWFGPQRLKFENLFSNGLLAADPPLAKAFLKEFDKLMKKGLTDREVYAGLTKFHDAHFERFEFCRRLRDEARVRARAAMTQEMMPPALIEKPHAKKLLDVGCSNGHITTGLSKIFNEASCKVYGIDLEPPADIDGFDYLEYDAQGRIPAPDNSFDFVTMFMVLHHVPESEKLLLEIARTMTPGGYMLVRETNAHTANHVLFNEVMDQIFYNVFDHNDHLAYNTCFRDAKSWKKMFNECGLDVVKIDAPEKRNVFIPCWFLLTKPAKASNP